ncbi:MAG: hypothetical protein FWD71_22960 [Oscillospiraceae bacterium]|nr:hypothetical protein [Oscillospiraceae bacterium]
MINKNGIHTFTASYRISAVMYRNLKKALFEYAEINGCKIIPDKGMLTEEEIEVLLNEAERANRTWTKKKSWTLYLGQNGLNIVIQKIAGYIAGYSKRGNSRNPMKFRNYYIQYIVNPAQIVCGDYFNIYTENNYNDVCARIDEITASVCESLPHMDDTHLRRVDFSIKRIIADV